MDNLESISPLDGRYYSSVKELSEIFSEYALIKKRVFIEIEYLIAFCRVTKEVQFNEDSLRNIYYNFSIMDAKEIKKIEKRTEHDVAAVIAFIKERVPENMRRFVHFGLTSEDVNNLAYGLMLKDGVKLYASQLKNVILLLKEYIEKYRSDIMLSHTHGEPATSTTLGKEFANYAVRFSLQYKKLKRTEIQGKLNGATGNFNAIKTIYPDINWINFSKEFIKRLGLFPTLFSTQILFADSYAELFDTMRRINAIIIDFARNVWIYFLLGYFSLEVSKESVGSSTMPHKINPILFENGEGNAEIAENLLWFFSRKLTKSRLQRDLSDSTVKRNIGVAFGHSMLAVKSIEAGLKKLKINKGKIQQDLETHPEIFSELLQLYLRKVEKTNGYKEIKQKLRGKKVSYEELVKMLPDKDSEALTSSFLLGNSQNLVSRALEIIEKSL